MIRQKKPAYPPSAERELSRSESRESREGKKKPAASYSRMGGSHTTLGDGALDCRVRNGNGYDNSSMATGGKPESRGLKRTTTHTREERGLFISEVK